ncbi:hypothetical protein KKG31_08505 [Patescibacteria group bacterium]|nr:hypothetical protein [Patescibacteria group bacterium]
MRLSSTQGNGVTFSRVALDITGNNLTTTGYGNNAYLTLYIDGVAKSTKTVTTSNSVVFDGFSKSIAVGTPVDIQVKANFAEAFSVGNFQATLTTDGLNAYDTLTSTTITGYATPAGAVFTMGTAVGTLAASNNNPLATLLLSPSIDQQIIAFKMTASNDSIRLYDVDLTGTNLSNLSNFRLTTDEGTVIATATTATNTAVTFAEIASSPSIAKDTSANYYVIADVNTNTNVGPIVLTVDSANVNIKGSNGNTIAAAGSSVVSRSHAIAENVITVAKAANTNKSLTTSALRFTVTAAGTDSVLLTGVTLNNALAGYTGTIGVRIYKSSINSANLAGSGVHVNGTATIFAMTQNSNANSTVDAGSTVEYIVALQGALIDPASSSQDWNVSLTDIYFGGITASTYNNIGELPMTEVK